MKVKDFIQLSSEIRKPYFSENSKVNFPFRNLIEATHIAIFNIKNWKVVEAQWIQSIKNIGKKSLIKYNSFNIL